MVPVAPATVPKDLAVRAVRRDRRARKGPAGRVMATARVVVGARDAPPLDLGRRLLAPNRRERRNPNLLTDLLTAASNHVMSGPETARAAMGPTASSPTTLPRHLLATRRSLRARRRAGRRRERSDLCLELSPRRLGALVPRSVRAKPSRVPGNSLPRLPQLWSCLLGLARGVRPTASVQRPRGGGRVGYPGKPQASARPCLGMRVDVLSRLRPALFHLSISLERL